MNVGDASGAFKSKAVCKPSVLAIAKAASAIDVALPTLVTTPVKFALVAFAVETAEVTNAVVATCVVLSPAVAVGAAGVPVNVGDTNGAAPKTSATGIDALADMAEAPFPLM